MEAFQTHIWELGLGIITALGMANAYFITRLIKKIDENATIVAESSKQMAILTAKVEALSDMQQRLTTVEKQVAVFEYVMKKGSHDPIG